MLSAGQAEESGFFGGMWSCNQSLNNQNVRFFTMGTCFLEETIWNKIVSMQFSPISSIQFRPEALRRENDLP